jgi:hypothetical protein
LAKTIDNQSGFRYNSSFFTDPFNPSFDRGLANFDVTRRLVISGIWKLPLDLPFRNKNGLARRLAEGWEVSGIASFQSGTPFTIFSSSGSRGENTFFERADLIGPLHTFDPRSLHSFDTSTARIACQQRHPMPTSISIPRHSTATTQCSASGNRAGIFCAVQGATTSTRPSGGPSSWPRARVLNSVRSSSTGSIMLSSLTPDHSRFNSNFGQITQARAPRIIQFALKFYF